MKQLITICLLVLVASAMMEVVAQERTYCGQDLAKTLLWLCTWDQGNKRNGDQARWQLVTTEKKLTDITSVCCDKPCSLEEIFAYC